MPETYLDIHNATVFRGNTKVFAGLSLTLKKGQNTCILGPNGAGKSTLLKLLTRELYPVAAKASHVKILGNETVNIWELRKQIGLVSQDLQNQYDAHVKGRDVVLSGFFGSVGMHGHFEVSAEQQARTDELLCEYDLENLQNRCFWHLSTGQQRRFLLARALAHKPPILILDEPTNGLDLKSAHGFTQKMRQLAQKNVTLLLVTHHLQEIIPEISRVGFLQNGQVLEDGAKADLFHNAPLSTLFDSPLHISQHNGFYQAFPEDS